MQTFVCEFSLARFTKSNLFCHTPKAGKGGKEAAEEGVQ